MSWRETCQNEEKKIEIEKVFYKLFKLFFFVQCAFSTSTNPPDSMKFSSQGNNSKLNTPLIIKSEYFRHPIENPTNERKTMAERKTFNFTCFSIMNKFLDGGTQNNFVVFLVFFIGVKGWVGARKELLVFEWEPTSGFVVVDVFLPNRRNHLLLLLTVVFRLCHTITEEKKIFPLVVV